MERTPLISVIVPVYNVAAYLSRCVESILSQLAGKPPADTLLSCRLYARKSG